MPLTNMLTPTALLTVGGMILNLMVIPTLVNSDAAVPRLQSVPSAAALVMMTGAYSLLSLWLPAFATGIGAVLWAGVAVQRAA